MSSDEIKALARNRATCKQKLTYLEKFVHTISSAEASRRPLLSDVQSRLDSYLGLLTEFNEVQTKIEELCGDDQLLDQFQERNAFDDRYHITIGVLKNYIQLNTPELQVTVSSGGRVQGDPLQNALLPKIKLPIFKGEYEQWLEFKTTFVSLIHSNLSLSRAQKFQYLRSSVDGYGKRVINSIEFTEDNYEIAWDTLCRRFDNKNVLIHNHFKSIFSIPQITRENSGLYSQLLETVSNDVSSLQGLKVSKESLFDSLIIFIVENKLDRFTYKDWKEEYRGSPDLPSLDRFLDFLKSKVDILETPQEQFFARVQDRPSNSTQYKFHGNGNSNNQHRPSARVHLAIGKGCVCYFCKGKHAIYNCDDFLMLSVQDRVGAVQKLGLCVNCLRSNHNTDQCRLSGCRKCNAKHNSLLHQERCESESQIAMDNKSTNLAVVNFNKSGTSNRNTLHTQVLLSTVVFKVMDSRGEYHDCRAILDSGSQSSLITQEFCTKLNLPFISTKFSIIGINQGISNITKRVNISFKSSHHDYMDSLYCYVVPVISNGTPSFAASNINFKIPDHIQLADETFYNPGSVDMLIGAEIFWDILESEGIPLGKGYPTLQNTKFGWIVSGVASVGSSFSSCHLVRGGSTDDDALTRFWELEAIPDVPPFSADDKKCEELFQLQTRRLENGQFVVRFPLKLSPSMLGDSKQIAIKRFLGLERRFSQDGELKLKYSEFIREYIRMGHMTLVNEDVGLNSSAFEYFLPHHGVIKETSVTTKLRVVFDGSCKTTSGWSLNDIQYTGPKIQSDLVNVLLRFRIYNYVVCADIMKMYRMIVMDGDHRPLQQVLWRSDPDGAIQTYQLNTVTYGTSSAPYLAIKCLQTLGNNALKEFPKAGNTILSDFYVDDMLTGSNDLEELTDTCIKITNILGSAGFHLRKWMSNNESLLNNLAEVDQGGADSFILNIEGGSKTLGLKWFHRSDTLHFEIHSPGLTETITKRQILSQIAQIFDPLGLVSPCIILSKLLIQRLWSLHVHWDEVLPREYVLDWVKYRTDLVHLNTLSISRNAVGFDCRLLEIHVFCDASQDAYCACVYGRSKDRQGHIQVGLLCAKSKVAPLKALSIPRLELCAALLAVELADMVRQTLPLLVSYHFWSDSQVVLSWIRTESALMDTFVRNRVSKIQGLSNIEQWHYVASKDNPADIGSRGSTAASLLSNLLWWHGPEYLLNPQGYWPPFASPMSIEELPERKRIKQHNFHVIESFDLFNKFSSLCTLKKVFAYVTRFLYNIKNVRDKRVRGPLTVVEVERSFEHLIRLAQQSSFPGELRTLKQNNHLEKNNRLASLSPFIDENGLLRVGGRLKHCNLDINIKHPILLDSKHPLSVLLFKNKHTNLLHVGPQALLTAIRQRYWVTGGKVLAKRIVRECIDCFKCNPIAANASMGNLPDVRVSPSLPFQTVGIDYAGPFLVKNRRTKGVKPFKSYVCVFICLSSKAIHLELVSSLTTEIFLMCLKRFTSRRGVPTHIYSDNGSTFKGACNELQSFGHFLHDNVDNINQFSLKYNIDWHFTPPYSPNFGGLWETAVKSMKFHLKRTLKTEIVTVEEFNTLLCQIEGILNSRPLFASSNDPNDYEPITPSHLLIGRPITSLPYPDVTSLPDNRLSRLEYVQKLHQRFWTRFSREYVTQLHQLYKWKTPTTNLPKGALVLVKQANAPPTKWTLGRVCDVHPGRDGCVRVASISTPKGIIKRSVRLLHQLPISSEVNED